MRRLNLPIRTAALVTALLCGALPGCQHRGATAPPPAEDWYRTENLFASFDAEARDLSLVNAYLLELACYVGDRGTFEVDRTLGAWGFTQRRDFRDIRTSTYGYVASNDRMVLVTFGGTDFLNVRDLLSDVDALQLVRDDRYGATPEARVHRGFRDSLNSVIDGVIEEVRRQDASPPNSGAATRPRRKLYVAGHSRGGAFAVLASAAFARGSGLPEVGGVYTFGQPRVGNGPFVDGIASLRVPLFRFVNRDDPIPTVPPAGLVPQQLAMERLGERLSERLGYQHGGVEVRIQSDGRLVRSSGSDAAGLPDPRAATSSIGSHYQPGYFAAIYAALSNPQLVSEPAWRAGAAADRVSALPRPPR
jgi:triacylglycerol lipase